MEAIVEVYIDSTHKTNNNKAELFAIIGEENGTGIPLDYMLMEKKPKEDSALYPREVTVCCTRFFKYARDLGLSPTLVRIDKSTAEINGIKVSI